MSDRGAGEARMASIDGGGVRDSGFVCRFDEPIRNVGYDMARASW